MNIHRKVGPFPVWAWGVAIAGGLVLGIYLRHRSRAAAQSASADPNRALDALTNYTPSIADPNSGLDSGGIISGLIQQNSDALSAILALAGGGGGNPPATVGGTSPSPTSTPTVTVASSSSGAAPATTAPRIDEPTYTPPPPADPAYPYSTRTGSVIDTGTVTSTGLPIQETPAVAQGAEVVSAATSSTGGVGGTGYLLMSDKTMRPTPGVNVMM